MPDPVAMPAGATTAACTAGTLTFAQVVACATGIPLELFVWGAIGGLIAIIYDEPRQPPLTGRALMRHVAGRIFSASVLGGISPALVALAPLAAGIDTSKLSAAALATLAGIATAFLPNLMRIVRLKLGGAAQ